jgi:hypothetical protein
MRLQLNNTPEQVELIKAMGSKNASTSREAQEAFAAFIGPVVQEVLLQAGTASSVYTDAPYDEDDSPSFPLDLYYDERNVDNHITVTSQSIAGGLPSSQVVGMQELKIATYSLDSAVSFLKKYARRGRLDIAAKAIERMAQEVLVKQERNAWAVVLKALAEGTTGGNAHITDGGGVGTNTNFQLDHLNKLMTLMKRINESFAGGTPAAAYSNGITDLYLSPEVMEDIRAFAYNAVGGSTAGAGATDLPDGVREEIYRSAGTSSIYGVTLNELIELGGGKKYNTLFDSFDSVSFNAADDEIIIGVDNSKGAFIRAIAQQSETGGTFNAQADDQFAQRSEKVGFFGKVEEGRVCLDSRAVVGFHLDKA